MVATLQRSGSDNSANSSKRRQGNDDGDGMGGSRRVVAVMWPGICVIRRRDDITSEVRCGMAEEEATTGGTGG